MKYWELLGLGSEPKGTGKIMSICMFIVIINGYFLEGLIEHYILDIITYTCVGVFFVLLMYIYLKNRRFRNRLKYFIIK
jgi:hypothetical protein